MFLSKTDEQTIIKNLQGDYIRLVAESFLVDRRARELSRRTLKFYREYLHPFIEYCDTNSLKRVQEITLDILLR